VHLFHFDGQPLPFAPAKVRRILRPPPGPQCAASPWDRHAKRIEVPRVEYEKLTDERLGEPSADIQARVEAARERQRRRFDGTDLLSNADMGPSEVRTFCQIDDAGKSLLRAAMHQLQMSARAYHRILKLSRTIADLAGSDGIETAHLAEAIQYRPRRQT
jgi:magnesium chelatase family protein